jgi:hypothetical protein
MTTAIFRGLQLKDLKLDERWRLPAEMQFVFRSFFYLSDIYCLQLH